MPLQVIEPRRIKLVGELEVKRILPFRERRMIGPFIFLDEMDTPLVGDDPEAGDVLPHPHIGLSTLTYLFQGELMHRDSIGTVQRVIPGEVNWMTSGSGIVHSERVPPEVRLNAERFHGMQAWVALPVSDEDCEPSFQHYAEIPRFEHHGVKIELVCGAAFGHRSPVKTSSPLFYFVAEMPAGTSLAFDPGHQETGIYLISGAVRTGGQEFASPVLLAFDEGEKTEITAIADTKCLFLGGERMLEKR
ncbi:MAG TPA: pirin family protein, partial [Candidatus Kapabacteria bacterium]|nr:pirin family protein [Candidatus Kapabacteria bacterium]